MLLSHQLSQSWRRTPPIDHHCKIVFLMSCLHRLRLGICRSESNSPSTRSLKKEMELERAFVKAGGTLLAGPDPTGIGGVVAGFGDQREVELLVEAGFTPLEAIHIATENGARFLQEEDRIGTLAPGKRADLVVVRGDPSSKISDIERRGDRL